MKQPDAVGRARLQVLQFFFKKRVFTFHARAADCLSTEPLQKNLAFHILSLLPSRTKPEGRRLPADPGSNRSAQRTKLTFSGNDFTAAEV